MIEKRSADGTVQYVVVEPTDPATPDHDASACGQCTYVGHRDFIITTPSQQAAAAMTLGRRLAAALGLYDPERSIVPLGRFTQPGWNGHSMFWLFTCPDCDELKVDYLHGYRLYLRCPDCAGKVEVHGDRFYTEAGLRKPPTAHQELARLRTLKRELGR